MNDKIRINLIISTLILIFIGVAYSTYQFYDKHFLTWVILTIIQMLGVYIAVFINRADILCSHDYKLLNQFEMKSEFDIIIENDRNPKSYNSLKRKHVSDYKCSKCNKLNRLTVETTR